MSSVAIITARCGSKRIPKKNIRDFLGKPIIAYAIECALDSMLFDEVMVSTDCLEIAEIAEHYGAQVPFLRSEDNANDFAGTVDVILEVLEEYKSRGIKIEKGCCIYPTNPLLRTKTLSDAYELFEKRKFDVVFPILQYSYPIQRSLVKVDDELVKMNWPENYSVRSQDLEPSFHDAGQFYWFRSSALMASGKLFTANSGSILLSEMEAQDIDNESDWRLAELKFRMLNDSFKS